MTANHNAVAIAAVALGAMLSSGGIANAQSYRYNWTGLYVGASVGYAWGSADTATSVGCPGNGSICVGAPDSNSLAVGATATRSDEPASTVGGSSIGYDWQRSQMVYGLVVDVGAMNLDDSHRTIASFPAAAATYTVATSVDTDWLATARGRIGIANGPFLMYATAGLAFTQLRVANSYTDTLAAGSGTDSATQNKTGVVIGGGAEYAMTRNWRLFGEYLFTDFGKVSATSTIVSTGGLTNRLTTSTELSAHILRGGVNYKF